MDKIYESQAFDALNQAKKHALLVNAQMKDENNLQDAGMRSIYTRLSKQNKGIVMANNEIESLHEQVRLR